MRDLGAALALAFVLEGALYTLFPEQMQRMAAQMAALSPSVVRRAGLVAACVGVAAIWLIRG